MVLVLLSSERKNVVYVNPPVMHSTVTSESTSSALYAGDRPSLTARPTHDGMK